MEPMDTQENMVHTMHNGGRCVKHISFKAIITGALVAIGLTFLFNVLTLGLGLSLFTQNESGQDVLVFATLAWIVAGGYAMLFIAGWVAGWQKCYGHSFHSANGFLHGFLVWTLYLIITLFLISLLAETVPMLYVKRAFFNITFPNTMSGTLSGENAAAMTHTVNKIGIGALSTFLIFFMGALGASIGAYCGTKQSEKCHGPFSRNNTSV